MYTNQGDSGSRVTNKCETISAAAVSNVPGGKKYTQKLLFANPPVHVPIQMPHEPLKLVLTTPLSHTEERLFKLVPTQLSVPVAVKRSEHRLELGLGCDKGLVFFRHETYKFAEGQDTVVVNIHSWYHLHHLFVAWFQTCRNRVCSYSVLIRCAAQLECLFFRKCTFLSVYKIKTTLEVYDFINQAISLKFLTLSFTMRPNWAKHLRYFFVGRLQTCRNMVIDWLYGAHGVGRMKESNSPSSLQIGWSKTLVAPALNKIVNILYNTITDHEKLKLLCVSWAPSKHQQKTNIKIDSIKTHSFKPLCPCPSTIDMIAPFLM